MPAEPPLFGQPGGEPAGLPPVILPERPNYRLHLLLFLLTVLTTVTAGAYLDGVDPFLEPRLFYRGLPFAAAILFILGIHESAHYLVSRRYGLRATLPFFIPAPPPFVLIGTLGAVIKIKSPIADRRALLDIGVSGPLAGFCASLPIAVVGLRLSEVRPLAAIAKEGAGISLGSSLLFQLLEKLSLPQSAAESELVLHPVAFAAWVGMWVTALNLLPIGQLDGGHIVCALFGRAHRFISLGVLVALLPLGFWWPGWLLWAALLLAMGWRHPPPLDPYTDLTLRHRILGWLAMAIFALTFTPVPFSVSFAP